MKIKVIFSPHGRGDRILDEFSNMASYKQVSEQIFVLTPWKDKYFQWIISDLENFKNKGELDFGIED